MYNQEIKKRFLMESAKNKSYAAREIALFDELGSYEASLVKDIAQMSKDEVISALNSLNTAEYATLSHYISVVRNYAKWCSSNGVFDVSKAGIMSVTIDDVGSVYAVSQTLFAGEKEFIDAMRSVRSFDDGYPEVVYLVFAWLGLEKSYALVIKDCAVDLANRVILDENGSVLVNGFSDEIYDILSKFVKCNSSTRSNGTTTFEVVKDRSVDRFVKKFCSRASEKFGDPITSLQMSSYLFKINRSYEELGNPLKLNYTNVLESGGLYRVFQLEQSGVDVFSKKNAHLVQQVFRRSKPYYKIMWKYKFYKKAFDL